MHAATFQSMTNTDRIPGGTKVRLPDGSLATAYPDCGIGRPWDGRYVTCQTNPATGGMRRDEGWRRDQLAVIS
jgi:hypothetical protein